MKRSSIKFTMIVVILSIMIFSSGNAFAEPPQLISIQGKLTDPSNNPITTQTEMEFQIHNSEAGTVALWSETYNEDIYAGHQKITPDSNGIFSVMLGSKNPLNTLDFEEAYWLEVIIEGETMSPRYKLTSAPYSLNTKPQTSTQPLTDSYYCKRTQNLYGALELQSADTICVNEFGAGWSFADTHEEIKKILMLPASAYIGLHITQTDTETSQSSIDTISSYAEHHSRYARIGVPDGHKENCNSWTSNSVYHINSHSIRPQFKSERVRVTGTSDVYTYNNEYSTWLHETIPCLINARIWCCPEIPSV